MAWCEAAIPQEGLRQHSSGFPEVACERAVRLGTEERGAPPWCQLQGQCQELSRGQQQPWPAGQCAWGGEMQEKLPWPERFTGHRGTRVGTESAELDPHP